MNYIIKTVLVFSTILFISACGSSGSVSNQEEATLNTSINGRVVDGYISNALVYLDLDNSGSWNSGEPKTNSTANGTFTFSNLNIEKNTFIPVVSVDGKDTATNKVFEGKLRTIIDTNNIPTGKILNITPLTDLISTLFLESTTKNSTTLDYFKTQIASAYSVSKEDIDKSPMELAGVFAKTQEIQQTKLLIESAVKKVKDKSLTSSELEEIRNEIKISMVRQINTQGYLDISQVLDEVDTRLNITIPVNEKNFIVSQVVEVKRALELFVQNKDLTASNLNNYQKVFESVQDASYSKLQDAQESDILSIVGINIQFAPDDNNVTPPDDNNVTPPDDNNVTPPDDNNVTPPDDNNVTPPDDGNIDDTMKEISFSGVVVDGYISGATVCLDADNNDVCDNDEPIVVTGKDGKFSFSDVEVKKDTFIAVLASGGIDTATYKAFEGEFKSVIDTNLTSQDLELMITPINDLVSIEFFKSALKDRKALDDAREAISNGLNLIIQSSNLQDCNDTLNEDSNDTLNEDTNDTLNEDCNITYIISDLDKDPMSDIKIFSKSQEIQYIKSLLEAVSLKSLDNNLSQSQEKDLRDNIKEVLVTQIVQNSNLDMEKIIIGVEIELNIVIPESEKTFVVSQVTEIRRVLNSSTVDIWALGRLQFTMDGIMQEAYESLKTVDINITDTSITKSLFSKSDAIFDKSACVLNDDNNSIADDNSSLVRVDDIDNGLSLYSSYELGLTQEENEVKIYYPKLENAKSGDSTVVHKENYYFSYDNAWVDNNNNYIYIQLPKDIDSPHICYRVRLESTIESDLNFIKVYSYSDIAISDFTDNNSSD